MTLPIDFEWKRRWYDKEPKIAQAVKFLELFPEQIRQIIVEGINRLVEKEIKDHKEHGQFINLGREKMLALYKSKNKMRWYDQDFVFHKMMNYFYFLSQTDLALMSQLANQLMQDIFVYLKACQRLGISADKDDISKIRDIFVQMGPKQAEIFLQDIEKELNVRAQRRLAQIKVQEEVEAARAASATLIDPSIDMEKARILQAELEELKNRTQ